MKSETCNYPFAINSSHSPAKLFSRSLIENEKTSRKKLACFLNNFWFSKFQNIAISVKINCYFKQTRNLENFESKTFLSTNMKFYERFIFAKSYFEEEVNVLMIKGRHLPVYEPKVSSHKPSQKFICMQKKCCLAKVLFWRFVMILLLRNS